jgi:dienelactone hydrolase
VTFCSATRNRGQRPPITRIRVRIAGLLTLLAASVTFVGAAPRAVAQASVKLHFSPPEGLVTDPVRLRVSDLEPGESIVIRADMQLVGSWESHATFVADRNGEVRLDRDRPAEGTYQGIDQMGLFWAMKAAPAAPGVTSPTEPPDVRDAVVTSVRVERNGKTIASGSYRRRFVPPDVRIIDVREEGLVGQLFEPAGHSPHPAILVLSGSEGGSDSYAAAAFASRGYVAFALAYFRVESLPRELVNIPMEYFVKGTEWLQRQRSVDPKRLAVYGKSRGSEAALLLATIAPQYRVVIAAAPSSVSGAGVGRQHANEPAWTYRGEPVPFAPNTLTVADLRARVDVAGGSIPIERSRAAVFLDSGGKDTISRPGASTLMGDLLIDRLRRSKHPYPYVHLSYPDAGHTFGMMYLPGPIAASGGGTEEANVKAGADSTPRLFAFLARNLRNVRRR